MGKGTTTNESRTRGKEKKGGKTKERKHYSSVRNFNEVLVALLSDLENTIDIPTVRELNDLVSALLQGDMESILIIEHIAQGFKDCKQALDESDVMKSDSDDVATVMKEEAEAEVEVEKSSASAPAPPSAANKKPERNFLKDAEKNLSSISLPEVSLDALMELSSNLSMEEISTVMSYLDRLYDDLKMALRQHYQIRMPAISEWKSLFVHLGNSLFVKSIKENVEKSDLASDMPDFKNLSSLQDITGCVSSLNDHLLPAVLESYPYFDEQNVLECYFLSLGRKYGVAEDAGFEQTALEFRKHFPHTMQVLFETDALMYEVDVLPWAMRKFDKKTERQQHEELLSDIINMMCVVCIKRYVRAEWIDVVESNVRMLMGKLKNNEFNINEILFSNAQLLQTLVQKSL